MMRLGICNELFEGWTWEAICEYVATLGYQGVEIAPFSLGPDPLRVSASERTRWRRVAERAGLSIIGLHWLLAKTEGMQITSPDLEVRRATGQYLAGLVDLCADLGGRIMVFGSPAQRHIPMGTPESLACDWAIETWSACLPALAQREVVLAIEPLGPQETNFLNTAEKTLQVIERLGSPQVRLHLDVKAMSTETRSFREIIWASRHQLAHFHANDPNLLGPGMGLVDFQEIITALQESGYQGWLSVEVFDFSPGAQVIAEQSVAYLRRLCKPNSR